MRLATHEDIEELVYLEGLIFPGNCFNETTLANELEHGRCWLIHDHQGNRIWGYLLSRRDGDLLDILRLGVHPRWRDRGLGSLLLERALKESQAVILTVQKENRGALRLYHKHGFRIAGNLAGEAGWVMSRR